MTTGFPAIYENFQGIIEARANTDGEPGALLTWNDEDLTTEAALGQQFGGLKLAEPPWFILTAERGVCSGELKLIPWYEGDGTGPQIEQTQIIPDGSFILFKPEAGVTWAKLFVKRCTIGEYDQTYSLEGESRRACGCYSVDAGVTEEFGTEADEPDHNHPTLKVYQIVEWLLDAPQPLNDYAWAGNRDIDTTPVTPSLFSIDEDQEAANCFADLAHLQEGDSGVPVLWGVDNGYENAWTGRDGSFTEHFFWKPRPDEQIARFYKRKVNDVWEQHFYITVDGSATEQEVNLLNWPQESPGAYYNVLRLKGGNGVKARFEYADGITAASGNKSDCKRDVPTLRNTFELGRYKDAFFKRYGKPFPCYEPFQIIIPSAGALPLPWSGYVYLDTDRHDALDEALKKVTLRHVKVTFGEQPEAEILIGEIEKTNPMIAKDGTLRPGVPLFEALARQRGNDEAVVSGGTGGGATNDPYWIYAIGYGGSM